MAEKRIGFCITGGGARISQQAAMCEFLVTKKERVPTIFAGTSAGGLLTVGVDSILAGRWTWDALRNVLFTLKNDECYLRIPIPEMAAKALVKDLPAQYDSSPQRKTFRRVLKEIGIRVLGDLKLLSYICAVDNETGDDMRWSNRKASQKTLELEDILMATGAIPFKFPPVRVPRSKGPYYVDGGAGRDFSPLEPLLDHPLDEIYIITPGLTDQPPKTNSRWIVDNTLAAVDFMLLDLFHLQLKYYPILDPYTDYYLIQPHYKKYFDPLDFEHGKEQFDAAWKWMEANFHKIKPLPKKWSADDIARLERRERRRR